jgi:hypothetical protein
MNNFKNGDKVEIRENYRTIYRLFGNKGRIKNQNTSCQQYTALERTEYYDVEGISMVTKKMDLIPVKKHHVKLSENGIVQMV